MSPVAVVTASDSGIGQESAKALAEDGFDVGITYKEDEAGANETLDAVEAAGRRGEVRQMDLTDLPDAAAVIDELADALGGLDALVNNAGTGDPTGEFLELSVPVRPESGESDGRPRGKDRQHHLGTRAHPAGGCLRLLRLEGWPRALDEGHGNGACALRHHG